MMIPMNSRDATYHRQKGDLNFFLYIYSGAKRLKSEVLLKPYFSLKVGLILSLL